MANNDQFCKPKNINCPSLRYTCGWNAEEEEINGNIDLVVHFGRCLLIAGSFSALLLYIELKAYRVVVVVVVAAAYSNCLHAMLTKRIDLWWSRDSRNKNGQKKRGGKKASECVVNMKRKQASSSGGIF